MNKEEKVKHVEWFPGGWRKRGFMGELWYIPPGSYEVGAMLADENLPEGIIKISMKEYFQLKEFIAHEDPNGIIHTDRSEDLKLINRLIDTLQEQIKNK